MLAKRDPIRHQINVNDRCICADSAIGGPEFAAVDVNAIAGQPLKLTGSCQVRFGEDVSQHPRIWFIPIKPVVVVRRIWLTSVMNENVERHFCWPNV